MCGCWRLAVTVISSRNRSTAMPAASSARRIFNATGRPWRVSVARYTVADPPAPISRSIRYRPANAAPGAGVDALARSGAAGAAAGPDGALVVWGAGRAGTDAAIVAAGD